MTAIALSAQRPLSVEALHALVGGAVHFIVHLTLERTDGFQRRYVASVAEVCGVGEGGRVATNEIYTPSVAGRAVPTGTVPARIAELERAGFDRSWLDHADGSWSVSDASLPATHSDRLSLLDGGRA